MVQRLLSGRSGNPAHNNTNERSRVIPTVFDPLCAGSNSHFDICFEISSVIPVLVEDFRLTRSTVPFVRTLTEASIRTIVGGPAWSGTIGST